MEQLVRVPNDIGQIIRRARRAKDMTQGDLADACGSWQRTISNVENGLGSTKIVTVLAILAVLDLELSVKPRENASSEDFETLFDGQ